MTQEIIVYRNPAEKAMWDMLSANGSIVAWLIPIAAGFITFFVVLSLIDALVSRFYRKPAYLSRRSNMMRARAQAGIALLAAAAVFMHFAAPLI